MRFHLFSQINDVFVVGTIGFFSVYRGKDLAGKRLAGKDLTPCGSNGVGGYKCGCTIYAIAVLNWLTMACSASVLLLCRTLWRVVERITVVSPTVTCTTTVSLCRPLWQL